MEPEDLQSIAIAIDSEGLDYYFNEYIGDDPFPEGSEISRALSAWREARAEFVAELTSVFEAAGIDTEE